MFEVKENKLYLKVEDKNVGYIIFDEQPNHFVGTYVFVNPEERGKKYAYKLVEEFVNMVNKKDKKIHPICHVIKRTLETHFNDMIV